MIRKVWYMILVLITIYLEIMYDSTCPGILSCISVYGWI